MEADFKQLAACYMSLMEGDTHRVEEALELMRKHKLIDENDEFADDEA